MSYLHNKIIREPTRQFEMLWRDSGYLFKTMGNTRLANQIAADGLFKFPVKYEAPWTGNRVEFDGDYELSERNIIKHLVGLLPAKLLLQRPLIIYKNYFDRNDLYRETQRQRYSRSILVKAMYDEYQILRYMLSHFATRKVTEEHKGQIVSMYFDDIINGKELLVKALPGTIAVSLGILLSKNNSNALFMLPSAAITYRSILVGDSIFNSLFMYKKLPFEEFPSKFSLVCTNNLIVDLLTCYILFGDSMRNLPNLTPLAVTYSYLRETIFDGIEYTRDDKWTPVLLT